MSSKSTPEDSSGASGADVETLTPVEREVQRRQSIGQQLYDALVSDVAKAQAVFMHRQEPPPRSR